MTRLCTLFFLLNFAFDMNASSVLASSFGYNSANATTAFQSAVQSDYDTVVVDLQSASWNVAFNHFFDLADKTIIFMPGVMLRALPGEFPGTGNCLLRFVRCHNITLIGYGAEFVMNKAEYVALGDSEYRHTLSLNNCVGIRIFGLTLRDSGGDGIYVGGANSWGETRTFSENIFIEDVRSINHYRQGMSITSVENMTVRHCMFTRTGGTLPEAGVDVEPYETYQRIVNLTFEKCVFTENGWAGLALALSFLDSTSMPVSIRVADCFFSQNSRPAHPYGPTELAASADNLKPVQGSVVFERCAVDSSQWTVLYTRKTAAAYLLSFRDCVFKDVSLNQNQPYNEPFFLEVPDYANPSAALGGIHFERTLLTYPTDFHFFRVYGWNTLEGVKDITGQMEVVAPLGDSIWLQNVPNTSNLTLAYKIQSALPATILNLEIIQPTAVECYASAAVFRMTRSSPQTDYPLAARYATGGTATFADDVHLPIGALVIPANALTRSDSVFARNDGLTEQAESAAITLLASSLYSVASAPIALQVLDCQSSSTNFPSEQEPFILIFPNPVCDIFQIKTDLPWQRVTMSDGLGRVVRMFAFGENLSAAGLTSGLYFLEISSEKNAARAMALLVKE